MKALYGRPSVAAPVVPLPAPVSDQLGPRPSHHPVDHEIESVNYGLRHELDWRRPPRVEFILTSTKVGFGKPGRRNLRQAFVSGGLLYREGFCIGRAFVSGGLLYREV